MFFISIFIPLSFGNNLNYKSKVISKDDYQEINKFDVYNVCELTDCNSFSNELPTKVLDKNEIGESFSPILSNGLMDSPWPMYCHDVRHTSRSPYSTVNTSSLEKWWIHIDDGLKSGIAISKDGTIYFGQLILYATYPNGTIKWVYEDLDGWIWGCCPAISEDGAIYIGVVGPGNNFFYAINPNGTLKWRRELPGWIHSSPAIAEDGAIYFGSDNNHIYALNPNGTIRWRYETGNVVYSSPAIGDDGTVFCGSHDGCLYALYPNNGTLKWYYNTGYYIRTSPCIGDDGTVYFVSLSNYLYAVYPNNGTLKWLTNVGAGTSPTIGWDGTIYAGYGTLHAVNPTDGSVKWTFDPGPDSRIEWATPCTSAEGTIYFGTHIGETDGGEIIAVNPDGSLKWRNMIATTWVMSAPAIGSDGTVYAGSWNDGPPYGWGFLHAIGPFDPDVPSAPEIRGPSFGRTGEQYWYYFKSTSPLNRDVYYHVDWGSGVVTDISGPYKSGDEAPISHTWPWPKIGAQYIKARARDENGIWGPWGEFKVILPLNQQSSEQRILQNNIKSQSKNSIFFQLLQKGFVNN